MQHQFLGRPFNSMKNFQIKWSTRVMCWTFLLLHLTSFFLMTNITAGVAEMKVVIEKTGGLVVLAESFGHSVFKDSFRRVFEKGEESLGLAHNYSRREDATAGLDEAIKSGNKEDIEKFSKRTVKVTKQHNEDCKRLLRLMVMPVIEAPSEAEAQCTALCKADKVYVVASEDMDSLTFGAPKFLRHLMDPSSRKTPMMEFDVSKVLEELNLTMDQFIDLCILCGCDYCDSIRGNT